MADEDKTFTQADVDRFVAEERRRNKEEIDRLKVEADEVRSALTLAEKTIEEKDGLVVQADERYKALEADLNSARGEATRYAVALEAGLPKTIASRLQGDDEETLRKDAEELSALIKTQGGGGGKLPGPTNPPEEPPTMNQLIRQAAGRE